MSKFWVKLQILSQIDDRTLCITTAKSGNSIHSCVRERIVGCQFRPRFWVKILSVPSFLAAYPICPQPEWQVEKWKVCVDQLNKIRLNFSTSTHICNYLISNMKHTLQNLCFGQRAFWVGWWASQERLKKISGVERSAAKSPKISPCPLNIYIDSLLRTFMANDIKFGSKDFKQIACW